ncbi:MAG: HIRAN domain-containing protein [Isosphaeraceae bacterium]
MKFSIRGLFAFEFTLSLPNFWKRKPAAGAAHYELDRFFIAGFQYHDGPDLIHKLEPGMTLVLVHELDNPHDPRAIALRFAGYHLGYVPRQRNRAIAALLDQGALLHAWISQVDADADPWNAVEVAVSVAAGSTLSASTKGKEPFLAEL